MPDKFDEWTPDRKERKKELDKLLESGKPIPRPEGTEKYKYRCRTCHKPTNIRSGTKCPNCGRDNTLEEIS